MNLYIMKKSKVSNEKYVHKQFANWISQIHPENDICQMCVLVPGETNRLIVAAQVF